MHDVAALGITLLAGSKGGPHKMAMLFSSMYEALAAGTASKQLTAARVSAAPAPAAAGLEALRRFMMMEPPKQPLLMSRAVTLKLRVGGDAAAAKLVSAVLMKHPLTPPAVASFKPINAPSKTADADCGALRAGDKWQAQCLSMMPGKPCMAQKPPFVPLFNASLVSYAGARAAASLTASIQPGPTYDGMLSDLPVSGGGVFAEEHRHTLRTSGQIGDREKFIAEYFMPNAALQVARVALQEAVARKLPVDASIRLLFAATSAARDAVVGGVYIKLTQQTVRPLTVLQCAWAGERIEAWAGPYQGVRALGAQRWKPYLQTPPFPGYVSGHSAVFAAGAVVLRRMLGEDVLRGANCATRKKGMSMVEPMIRRGEKGYVAGVTDRPNSGPKSKGYSPAKDITMCWRGFTEYSEMLAYSRELGGIHIPVDNRMGIELGRQVGERMVNFAMALFDGHNMA